MSHNYEVEDLEDLDDDERFGVEKTEFLTSIGLQKYISLFEPFLLPNDREKICLAWLFDATEKNFEQLGIETKDENAILRQAIHAKLVELNFDFEGDSDDEDKVIVTNEKKSPASHKGTETRPLIITSSEGNANSAPINGSPSTNLYSPARFVTDTTIDEDILFKSSPSRPNNQLCTDPSDDDLMVYIANDDDDDENDKATHSNTKNVVYQPIRNLSNVLARSESARGRKTAKVDNSKELRKQFDKTVWDAIAKTRGSMYYKVDPSSRPLSPSNRSSIAGSPSKHSRSSPTAGLRSPCARPSSAPDSKQSRPKSAVATSPETDPSAQHHPLVYGEMVASFNAVQKDMSHLKADILRPFKNEIGCEIVNLLLIGPRRTKMYLCIGHKWFSVPSEKSIGGYCALTGETLNIPEVHLDNRFNIDADVSTGFVTKSMLCKPVISRRDKQVIGVVELINKLKKNEQQTVVLGTDSFSAEDEKALDLFIVNISKEIDEKFRNLYISDDVMDSFSKPISEAIGVGSKDKEPHFLKSTTAAEMNHAFNHELETRTMSAAVGRDLYADHMSTRLKVGVVSNTLGGQEERDKEIGNYLRTRNRKDRNSLDSHVFNSPGSPVRTGSAGRTHRVPSPTARRREEQPNPAILYPPLFPSPAKKKLAPIFK